MRTIDRTLSFDPTFGLKRASLAIASLIYSEADAFYNSEYSTIAWFPFYNGRERSIGVAVTNGTGSGYKCWVFGEHRSSDSLFLDRFEVDNFLNPPTLQSIDYGNVYANRQYFGNDDYSEVADLIVAEITTEVTKTNQRHSK